MASEGVGMNWIDFSFGAAATAFIILASWEGYRRGHRAGYSEGMRESSAIWEETFRGGFK